MKLDIVKLLLGGDKRSIGNVERVICEINKNPAYLEALFQSLLLDDEIVRMRAIDAIEKISRQNKKCLAPYKKLILNKIIFYDQKEMKWHVAQVAPRLSLTVKEKRKLYDLFVDQYLVDKSSIVKTNTMQALVDLSFNDETLKRDTINILKKLIKTGTPAMKARGKKLLLQCEENPL